MTARLPREGLLGYAPSMARKGLARPPSFLETAPGLLHDIVMASKGHAPTVSWDALVDEREENEASIPDELTAGLVSKLRVWPLLRLEYDAALFAESATVWVVSDGSSDLAWLVHFVEGEPCLYPLGKGVASLDADSDAATRARVAKRAAAVLADEGFGSPSDLVVPSRFAWLLDPLSTASRKRRACEQSPGKGRLRRCRDSVLRKREGWETVKWGKRSNSVPATVPASHEGVRPCGS